ncbi:NAD-dependent epimerase/dehydratase family protein [Uliginosibacterium aquaticum]|uniref:NAD-dependent epimerase/dehydratase family protein n=1 Tax=Uliginosibacterium aquaticum TaxID=2731212 RepID=A0ABX2IBE7_9RHOO|nr:NAD-dependent epimerase/dehydratase family protein [Uliginosibacterium aquaticum]NSL53746.1 NAD-dependent epimerase/dehydratase family protein [Uliginosibacterium aquaticum]
MRILVTGANGFVGREFCRRMREGGHAVRPWLRQAIAGMPDDAVIADLRTLPECSNAFLGVDVVLHLAARVHKMQEDVEDPEAAYALENVAVTRHLVEQAARAGVKRFVFVSSIKACAERSQGRPVSESDVPAPEDTYGRSKLAAEQVLREVADALGMEWVIVRPVLVYGAGVGGNFERLVRLVKKGIPLPFGRVEALRSFVNVWNLAALLECCCVQSAAAGEVFHAADTECGTATLMCEIATAAGEPARLVAVPLWLLRVGAGLPGVGPAMRRLTGELRVSGDKARAVLGWVPSVSRQEALRRTVGGEGARFV